MFSLIVKDVLVLKRQLIFGFFYILVIIVSFQSVGELMSSTGVTVLSYMLLATSCAYEDKNNAHIMLNSLPLKRSSIVLAKYISVLLYFAIGSAAYSAAVAIISALDIPIKVYPLTPGGVGGAVIVLGFIAGIYLPVFFKVGYTKAQMLNLILFFAFFFGMSSFFRLLHLYRGNRWIQAVGRFLESQGDISLVLISIITVLLLLSISFTVSLKLYSRREF